MNAVKKFFLLIMLIMISNISAQEIVLESKPYIFDLGTAASDVSDLTIKLTPSNIYTNENGFGFKNQYESFVNEEYRRRVIRDDLTYDGIESNKLSFKIDLLEGNWFFTFWMEAGYEDIATTELYVNDKKHDLTWHQLKVGAEGRLSPIDLFSYLEKEQTVTARPWELEQGDYILVIEGEDYEEARDITIKKFGQKVLIDIPSQKLVTAKFIKK